MKHKNGKVTNKDILHIAFKNKQTFPVYHKHLLYYGLGGGIVGAIVFGFIGYGIVSGPFAVTGLGQFAASGPGLAVFTAAGLGFSLGGLLAALIALFRIKNKHENVGS